MTPQWGWLVGLLVGLLAQTATAGPPESLVQVVVDPGDHQHVVLRYENSGDGLLQTFDGGERWHALCPAAVTPGGVDPFYELGRIALDGAGVLSLAGPWAGVHDDGRGCAFTAEPLFSGQAMRDFARDPADPNVLFAVNATAPDGRNGLFRRDAAGAWSALGSRDETLLGRLHLVALPQGGLRVYQSGSRGVTFDADGQSNWPNFMIRVSDDLGETWTEYPYDVGEPYVDFALEAVDPINPDRIVVSLHRRGAVGSRQGLSDEVLISEDRGLTFATYATLTQFGALAMASDGRVWIGDQGDLTDVDRPAGLWSAPGLGEAPSILDDSLGVTCLGHVPEGDYLWLCSRLEAGPYGLDGSGYAPNFAFETTEAVAACPGVDNVAICRAQLTREWCSVAHAIDAPLCCAYLDERGRIGGAQPDDLQCALPDAGAPSSVGEEAHQSARRDGGPRAMVTGDGGPTLQSSVPGDGGTGFDRGSGGCGCRLARPTLAPSWCGSAAWAAASIWLLRRRRSA